jgi:hypothetical protein
LEQALGFGAIGRIKHIPDGLRHLVPHRHFRLSLGSSNTSNNRTIINRLFRKGLAVIGK